jgi:hypothetical protein
MKHTLLAILAALISLPTFAFNNDWECETTTFNDDEVVIEVETPFGSSYRTDMKVTVTDFSGQEQVYNYPVTIGKNPNTRRMTYLGTSGLNLRINHNPDMTPQWGRRYRADFQSYDIQQGRPLWNIDCEFTGDEDDF